MQLFSFKSWMESSLRDIIKPVPQSPKHHAEGDVFTHTIMVRQQLTDAIAHFQQVTADKDSVFGNLDPNLSKSDINLLKIGAWMHDIGKASATTFTRTAGGEEKTIKYGQGPLEPGDKIQAIGHEQPWHFEPMMKKLGPTWKQMYEKASPEDKADLWFVIQHHMDLKSAGFGKKLLAQLLDQSGKFKNDRKIKLLLILIMMDQSGRIGLGELNGSPALPGISGRMKQSALDYHQNRMGIAAADQAKRQQSQVYNDPEQFTAMLKSKGLDQAAIQKAFRSKFGRDMQESFRFFLMMEESGGLTPEDKEALKVIIHKVMEGDQEWFDGQDIVVGKKDNYRILNYIQGKPTNQFNLLTRGLIIDSETGKIVSMPFKRFGNFGEDIGGYKSSVDFSKSEVIEKLDGSMLGVAFPSGDVSNPIWHTRKMVSTTANPKQRGFDGEEVDIMGLAGQYVKKLRFSPEDADKTWIFEFIHSEKPVVTKYKPEQLGLHLIGARNLQTYEEYSEEELDEMAAKIGAGRPRRWGVKGSHDAVKQMMDQFADDFEGFVMRQTDTGDRAKVKKKEYFKQHGMIDQTGWRDLIPKWIEGETTEIATYFPHVKQKFEQLEAAFQKKVYELAEIAHLYLTHFTDRKQLAMALRQDRIPGDVVKFVYSGAGKPLAQLPTIIGNQIKSMSPYAIMELLGLR